MRAMVTAKKAGVDFPWNNGVLVAILGDNTLNNVINELHEIKKMVNADANKRGLKLSDLTITIEFKE